MPEFYKILAKKLALTIVYNGASKIYLKWYLNLLLEKYFMLSLWYVRF